MARPLPQPADKMSAGHLDYTIEVCDVLYLEMAMNSSFVFVVPSSRTSSIIIACRFASSGFAFFFHLFQLLRFILRWQPIGVRAAKIAVTPPGI
jgi:hypothetical protein